MTTLSMLSHLHQLQAFLTAAWAGLSELFTIATALWIFNQTVRAIRFVGDAINWTWNAGQATGRFLLAPSAPSA